MLEHLIVPLISLRVCSLFLTHFSLWSATCVHMPVCVQACAQACLVTSVMSSSLRPYGLQPTRLLSPWDSPGKNTGVGLHALRQGTFPTQGRSPCLLRLLHWRVGSQLVPPGKPPNMPIYLQIHLLFCGFKSTGKSL